jgi:hypothetical protein
VWIPGLIWENSTTTGARACWSLTAPGALEVDSTFPADGTGAGACEHAHMLEDSTLDDDSGFSHPGRGPCATAGNCRQQLFSPHAVHSKSTGDLAESQPLLSMERKSLILTVVQYLCFAA